MTGVMVTVLVAQPVHAAINQIPIPNPKPGSYGLEATKKQPPPDTAPSISTPGSGASYGNSPITVGGTCKTGLLVEILNNGVLVGTVMCVNGSFTIQVSLFTGQNDLTAIQYDDLGQASPVSNTVSVTFNNASPTAFGASITLTSVYGRRAANPNDSLSWPLQLSGGTGPYAFSIDWGDGNSPELKSQALAGLIDIKHTYKQAGIYKLTIRVTDVNGVSAFLQLVVVVNGTAAAAATGDAKEDSTTVVTKVLWIPALIILLLLLPTYWLGRRSMMVSLRKRLEKDMESFKEL